MKWLVLVSVAMTVGVSAVAASPANASQPSRSPAQVNRDPASRNELSLALQEARRGDFMASSYRLFELSFSPQYASRRVELRYLLGLMLYQMKMYQLSAFQFIGVIRDGNNRFVSKSLEKLSLAADQLGDSTLLNYAISRIKVENFPADHRDMLYFRIGEFQLNNEQYADAIKSLQQVSDDSPVFDKALYLIALAYAESNQPLTAVKYFQELIDQRADAPVTDTTRVAAIMGKARGLYQNKNWDAAIQTYRQVPRDSEYWHEELFESSWAMFRSGRFREAMSNFQTLHSPYFESSYIPESLLLRSIVYLYLCKYDEMDKTLNLFDRIYQPVYNSINNYLSHVTNEDQYFTDIVYTLIAADQAGFNPANAKLRIPYLVTRKIMKEGDFHRDLSYIKKLILERRRVLAMPGYWRRGAIGRYAMMTLNLRLTRARQEAGQEVRNHMLEIRSNLIDLFEQEGFIRYEMLNSKKQYLKKVIAGKILPAPQVNQSMSRDYYIQNGYQYWPFRGEYWLDELGDYFYLGTSSCE